MNSRIINMLKEKDYIIPSYLLKNYKMLNIGIDSFVVLICLLGKKEPILCDYGYIADELNLSKKDVMIGVEELKHKGIIEVRLSENNEKKLEEHIFLDLFYNKVFMNIISQDNKDETPSNIYSAFEKEFGRTLSPIEYELISGWLECPYEEELILEALKESVLSGVNNLRYIDRILFEWSKKGIKTVEQARKNKEKFVNDRESVDVPDFDWLNNDESL